MRGCVCTLGQAPQGVVWARRGLVLHQGTGSENIRKAHIPRAFRASENSALRRVSARRCIHRWSRWSAAVGSLVARHGVWPLFWGDKFRDTGLGPLRPLLNFCGRFADTLSSRHGMRPRSRNSQIARAIGSRLVCPCLYRGEAIPHRTDPDNAFVSKPTDGGTQEQYFDRLAIRTRAGWSRSSCSCGPLQVEGQHRWRGSYPRQRWPGRRRPSRRRPRPTGHGRRGDADGRRISSVKRSGKSQKGHPSWLFSTLSMCIDGRR